VAVFLGTYAVGFEQSIVVMTLASALAAAVYASAPGIGLLGVGLLCTLDVPIRHYAIPLLGLPWNTINFGLLTLVILTPALLLQMRARQSIWLAGFAAVLALQMAYSVAPMAGLQGVLEVVAGLILCALFLRCRQKREVLSTMAILNATASAACVLVYLTSPPQDGLANGNAMGQVPVAGLASIALAAAWPGAIRRWALMGVLTAANLALVFALASRGSLIVAMLLATYFLLRIPGLLWKLGIVVVVAASVGWASTQLVEDFDDAIAKWSILTSRGLAQNERVEIMAVGWSTFRSNPLGTGTGSFQSYSGYYRAADRSAGRIYGGRESQAAHSAWVKVMAENGLPGLVLMVGYMLTFVSTSSRNGGPGRRYGVYVAGVISIAFLFVEFQSKGIWMFAAGATAVLTSSGAGSQSWRRAPVEAEHTAVTGPTSGLRS
jgi:hypothetical protein